MDKRFASQPSVLEDKFKTLERQELEITKKQSDLIHGSIVQIQRSVKALTVEFEVYSKTCAKDVADLRGSIAAIHSQQEKLKMWSVSVDARHVKFGSSMNEHKIKHDKHLEVHAGSVEVSKVSLAKLESSIMDGHKPMLDRLQCLLAQLDDKHGSIYKEIKALGCSASVEVAGFAKISLDKHATLDKRLAAVHQLLEGFHGDMTGKMRRLEEKHVSIGRQVCDIGRMHDKRHKDHLNDLGATAAALKDANDGHIKVIEERHVEMEAKIGKLTRLHEERHESFTAELRQAGGSVSLEVEKHVAAIEEKHVATDSRMIGIEKQLAVVKASACSVVGQHVSAHVDKHVELDKRIVELSTFHAEKHESITAEANVAAGSISATIDKHSAICADRLNGLQGMSESRHVEYSQAYVELDVTAEAHRGSLLEMLDDLAHGHHQGNVGRLDALEALMNDHHDDHVNSIGQLDAAHGAHVSLHKEESAAVALAHSKNSEGRLEALQRLMDDRHGEYGNSLKSLDAAHEQHKADFDAHRKHVSGPEFFAMLLPQLRITKQDD